MKIKEVKTEQFAGVHNLDVKLDDGLNVIYGPNESGKSTLVNLISSLLFQDAKTDARKDKYFRETYLPSKVKSGIEGDSSDGEIKFVSDDGTPFSLHKNWFKNNKDGSSVSLKDSSGARIHNQDVINDKVEEILKYGKGVYNQLLLSSQDNTEEVLRSLIDQGTTGEGDEEVIDGASKAFAESDGVSMDALQTAIEEKINDIEGSHWDYEQQKPVRKRDGSRWNYSDKNDNSILKAYYEVEDCRIALNECLDKQKTADVADQRYQQAKNNADKAQSQYSEYQKYAALISSNHQRAVNKELLAKQLRREEPVLEKWPSLDNQYKAAVRLGKELKNRQTVDQFENAKALKEKIDNLKDALNRNGKPDVEDVRMLANLELKLKTHKSRLEGLNLFASIRMLHNHEIHITSISTGKPVELKNGKLHISEAIRIDIPNVMEMELTPGDIDMENLRKQISETESQVQQILQKYDAHDSIELSSMHEKAESINQEIDDESYKLTRLLNGNSLNALKTEFEKVQSTPREITDIKEELERFGIDDPDRTAAVDQQMIQGYKQNYSSISDLQKSVDQAKNDLQKLNAQKEEQIPEEYQYISDPEQYQSNLEKRLSQASQFREDAFNEKVRAEADRDQFLKDRSDLDLQEQYESAEQKFNQLKEDLAHWKHIQQVFKEEKEKVASHPLDDLTKHFEEYLNLLTDGSVTAETKDPEKLDLTVYSGNNLMNYERLSEGTKDTVSLAFRLAVLDHLFPDGGGIIALDDPFTDMDEKRLQAACRLVQKSSVKHQIIFLTCREDVAESLGGNQIHWE